MFECKRLLDEDRALTAPEIVSTCNLDARNITLISKGLARLFLYSFLTGCAEA